MLNLAQQECIRQFLESPINSVKSANISDGLKILVFRAMRGESSLFLEQQQQLLAEAGLNVYITLILDFRASYEVPLNSFSNRADPLFLLTHSQPNQETSFLDIFEFIAAELTKEINALLPSLKIRAANAYVNSALNKQNLVDPPSSLLGTSGIIPQEANMLTPEELEIFYLADNSNNLNFTNDYNAIMIQTIIQRDTFIMKLEDLLGEYFDSATCSSYPLDKNGNIDINQTLREHLSKVVESFSLSNNSFNIVEVFQLASKFGLLDIVQRLWQITSLEQQTIMLEAANYRAFREAASGGQLIMAQWLWQVASLEQQVDMFEFDDYDAFRETASSGHLPVAQWLWQIASLKQQSEMLAAPNDAFAEWVFALVTQNGQLALAQWLWQIASPEQQIHMFEAQHYRAFIEAAHCNHLTIAQWLWQIASAEQRTNMIEAGEYDAFMGAADNGHFTMLQWLWQIASPNQQTYMLEGEENFAFRHAASSGRLDIMQWLWQIATPEQRTDMIEAIDYNALRERADNGDRTIVEWLLKQDLPKRHRELIADYEEKKIDLSADSPHFKKRNLQPAISFFTNEGGHAKRSPEEEPVSDRPLKIHADCIEINLQSSGLEFMDDEDSDIEILNDFNFPNEEAEHAKWADINPLFTGIDFMNDEDNDMEKTYKPELEDDLQSGNMSPFNFN